MNTTEFEFQPHLRGPSLCLRPLTSADFESVFTAASDPLIWAQHPSPLRYQPSVFQTWFTAALAGRALLVEESASGRVIGSSRYYDWSAETREVAIGFTFLTRDHWGGDSNRMLKRLMLDHAFRWADTVWFHVGAANERSRRAMEKIGARLVRRGPMDFGGGPQDYLFFRLNATDPRP